MQYKTKIQMQVDNFLPTSIFIVNNDKNFRSLYDRYDIIIQKSKNNVQERYFSNKLIKFEFSYISTVKCKKY